MLCSRPDSGFAVGVLRSGTGGIGKSSLLREFADRARRAGRHVVVVDGRVVGPSTGAFQAAAGDVAAGPGGVLVIDTFEQCQPLETWLREVFLPGLPTDAVVAVGGRQPLEIEWLADPGWSQTLRTIELQPFSSEQSSLLLTASGIERSRHRSVIGFAGGNPLALILAAAVVTSRPGTVATWQPSGETLVALLNRLVDQSPAADGVGRAQRWAGRSGIRRSTARRPNRPSHAGPGSAGNVTTLT